VVHAAAAAGYTLVTSGAMYAVLFAALLAGVCGAWCIVVLAGLVLGV